MDMKIDFSGYDGLIKIIKLLSEGNKISKRDWDSLFNTPGFQTLIKNEFPRDFFEKAFTLAFDPTKEKERREALQTHYNHYINYYSSLLKEQKTIEKNIEMVKKDWVKIKKEVLKEVSHYLPKISFKENPEVSFLIFDQDARGYERIVVDVSFLKSKDLLVKILAHEAHHFFRNQLLKYDKKTIEANDEKLVWIIEQIHSEGLADQIDKELFIYSTNDFFPAKYKDAFKAAVVDVTNTLKEINKLFLDNENNNLLGEKIQEKAILAGHPIGYYMVKKTIERNGKEELINEIGNPFKLFALFEKYSNEGIFSNTTLNKIAELEKKYLVDAN